MLGKLTSTDIYDELYDKNQTLMAGQKKSNKIITTKRTVHITYDKNIQREYQMVNR